MRVFFDFSVMVITFIIINTKLLRMLVMWHKIMYDSSGHYRYI